MSAEYLLDTNVLIAALKGEPRALLSRLATLAPERLHLSSIVLAELMAGAAKAQRKAETLGALQAAIRFMTPAPFDPADAETYGQIRAALERKGASIGPMDLLIAAQAVARDLVLVTDNLREFKRVPGLRCKNWLRPSK